MRRSAIMLAVFLLCTSGRAEGAEPSDPQGVSGPRSYLSTLWEMDGASRRARFAIVPHNPSYILPWAHETSPNEGPVREANPGRKVMKDEVKFQISFKTKLWQDVLGKGADLWLAYTQLSLWQFYDFDGSAPFRETNYEPEVLLNIRTEYGVAGFRGRMLNFGFNHQSNGQTRPLSRSWNRIVANAGFERENLVLVLGAWYRIPEDEREDDNPGIERFVGYGRIQALYFPGRHRFGLSLRNNLRARGNKGSVQVDWNFPLIERIDGYVQYFNGYEESLLDYNASANRVGVGITMKDW